MLMTTKSGFNKAKSHGVLIPNYTLKAAMSESVKLVLFDLVLNPFF